MDDGLIGDSDWHRAIDSAGECGETFDGGVMEAVFFRYFLGWVDYVECQ